jgi:hypothetical protein
MSKFCLAGCERDLVCCNQKMVHDACLQQLWILASVVSTWARMYGEHAHMRSFRKGMEVDLALSLSLNEYVNE